MNGHKLVQVVSYGKEDITSEQIRVPDFNGVEPARVRLSGRNY